MLKDVKGQHEQELYQESLFNLATTQNAEIRERLAKCETHIEYLRGEPMEAMMGDMGGGAGWGGGVSSVMASLECAVDDDCGVTEHCMDGRCQEPVAEEAPAPPDLDPDGIEDPDFFEPPPPKPESRRPKAAPKLDKFEDLKDFVQREQRPWVAE